MFEAIINFLNLKLELLDYFEQQHCLCELKSDSEGKVAPVEYVGNGNYTVISHDEFDGVSYWRLRDKPTQSVLENIYQAGKRVEVSIPLRLVFSVRRTKLTTDDAYAFDRIKQTIVKQFNFDDGVLKTTLGCEKVTVNVPTSNANAKDVWDDETDNTGTFEPTYEIVYGSIDIDVSVIYKGSCLPTECDDVDSNILHAFDFCKPSVVAQLTAAQVACLEAELCGTCADATVQLNGTTVGTIASGATDSFAVNLDGSPSGVWDGTAWQVTSTPCADATIELNGVEMTTIPSGDTENITVLQSSGATQVGSKQGTHWRIDDSPISINGSPVADVKAEDALDIDVLQDGSPIGSWNGSAWIVPDPIAPTVTIVASNATPNYTDTITLTETTSGAPTVNWTITDGVDIYEATGNPINLDTTQFGYDVLSIVAITVDTQIGRGTSSVTVSNTPEDIYDAFDAAASVGDATIKSAWVCAIRDWNVSGVWSKMPSIAIMVGGTSTSHAVDLKDPTQVITWYGSPTHNAKGALMNGSSQYGVSWYNPQAEGADKNSFGLVYCNKFGNTTTGIIMGEGAGGVDAYLRQLNSSTIGSNITAVSDSSNDSGYSTVIRESSTYVFKLSGLLLEGSSSVTNTQTNWINASVYFGRSVQGYGGTTLMQFAAITEGMSVAQAQSMIMAAQCANSKFR